MLPTLVCVGFAALGVRADEVRVAVAANFLSAMNALASEFETATGQEVVTISGSTGQLYAQIVNGAPFDVLLAADRARPRRLAGEGYGVPSSVFTYAVGRLALWSREPDLAKASTLAALDETEVRWIAIANPELAPYGAAAREALESLGVWVALGPRIVQGQNIAQTFALVETRNAELGFVALSQALGYSNEGAYVLVPDHLHAPIRQDAVLLERGADNAAARALVDFLASEAAAPILERFGYFVPSTAN